MTLFFVNDITLNVHFLSILYTQKNLIVQELDSFSCAQ